MDPNTQTPSQPSADPQAASQPVAPAATSSAPQVFNPSISSTQAAQTPQPSVAQQTAGQPENSTVPAAQPAVPLPATQPQPPVTGPVVGGVTGPQFTASASDLGQPKKHTKLKIALAVLTAFLIIGGGLVGYFGFIKDADLKQAMKASDAFMQAIQDGDAETAAKYMDIHENLGFTAEDIKDNTQGFSTDLKRYSQEYKNMNGSKRAIATYEVRFKFLNTEIVQPWVNLLEKRNGKWVVVNIGPVEDKSNTKISDFSDAAFRGEEDITSDESSAENGRAGDIERETDIKAMHGQLEAFFAQNGYYPTLANMNDKSFRSANMRGLDDEALKDPEGNGGQLSSAPAARAYTYQPTSRTAGACDNGVNFCDTYILTATRADGSEYTKEALN